MVKGSYEGEAEQEEKEIEIIPPLVESSRPASVISSGPDLHFW
jgi:hypothetical protein